MKLQNQVCSLEQAKKLDELGVIAKAAFYHLLDTKERVVADGYFNPNDNEIEWYPAYTVSELGVAFGYNTPLSHWLIYVKIDTSTKTLMWKPDFLADCLIEALESGRTTADEVNQRLKAA